MSLGLALCLSVYLSVCLPVLSVCLFSRSVFLSLSFLLSPLPLPLSPSLVRSFLVMGLLLQLGRAFLVTILKYACISSHGLKFRVRLRTGLYFSR